MLFNSIFRNVNVTLLCTTNTPAMLYAPEQNRTEQICLFGVLYKYIDYFQISKNYK